MRWQSHFEMNLGFRRNHKTLKFKEDEMKYTKIILIGLTLWFAATSSTGGIVIKSDGKDNYFVAGQACIKLKQELRNVLASLEMRNGVLTSNKFGIPSIDLLNEKFGVFKIVKIDPNPRPHPEIVRSGFDLWYTLYFPQTVDVFELVRVYAKDVNIEDVTPDWAFKVDEIPNDPLISQQWFLPKLQSYDAFEITHGDSTGQVTFGPLDTGTDWTHEDIEPGLWINGPEDINGNGKFDTLPPPLGDLDGIDNDGDGFVDDVIGWDFYSNDYNPMPSNAVGSDHGTHVWGCVSAFTNNLKGVAGVGYRTKGFAFRCGDDGFVNISAAIGGINFMMNHGGDVFNMSFGGPSEWPSLRTAIANAYAAGLNACGSAGNDGVEAPRYPGATQYVIGVMASDENDRKAGFSNYGIWFDVCAPGVQIMSTVPRNRYEGNWNGTSMSSPIAAGVVTMIRAMNPSWSNAQVESLLFATCDSMPDTLFLQGKLGYGRVNLVSAVGINIRSYLKHVSYRINDSPPGGNGNGIAEEGETVGLITTLVNRPRWQNATGVSATLSTTDSAVSITKSNATYPNINSGQQGNCSADSFVFYVQPTMIPHWVTFQIKKRATPKTVDTLESFRIPVGFPRILLVDDDAGANYEIYYRPSIEYWNALYDTFNVSRQGSPDSTLLKRYQIVIWFTGDDSTTTLTPADTVALRVFLNAGRKLFITGQNIGQDIAPKYPSFYTNYLRASFLSPSTGNKFLRGVQGDPIGGGLRDTIAAAGGGGANNANSNDEIGLGSGADSVFIYRGTSSIGALKYGGTYKLVYFSFPFEAIDGATNRYLQRDELMRRILAWFGGVITGVEREKDVKPVQTPSGFSLAWAHPNPFTKITSIKYSVPLRSRISLRVYNVTGQLVRTLVDREEDAGIYNVEWDGKDVNGEKVASGVYFSRLVWGEGNFSEAKRIVLVR